MMSESKFATLAEAIDALAAAHRTAIEAELAYRRAYAQQIMRNGDAAMSDPERQAMATLRAAELLRAWLYAASAIRQLELVIAKSAFADSAPFAGVSP